MKIHEVPQYFSYSRIAKEYRNLFVSEFLRPIFRASDQTRGKNPLRIDLACNNSTNVNSATIFVHFDQDFTPEVWAGNTVDLHNGKWVATVDLNKSLFTTIGEPRADFDRYVSRKCVITHEWLEIMFAICNGGRSESRGVKGQAHFWAMLAGASKGLPMEDPPDHRAALYLGLREALVSKSTIIEKLSDLGMSYPDDVRSALYAAIESSNYEQTRKWSYQLSEKIHVEQKLVDQRLEETFRALLGGRD